MKSIHRIGAVVAALGISMFCLAFPEKALAASHEPAWTVSPSPNNGQGNNQLAAESCTGSRFCVAVGNYVNNSGVSRTLVDTWNGSAWSVTNSPNRGSEDNALDGVSCTGPTFCVAVGSFGYAPNRDTGSLAEKWNGTSWSILSTSVVVHADLLLLGVSCTSPTDCKAAGYFTDPAVRETRIYNWNGKTWSQASSPDRGMFDRLTGISCASASFCAAVGYFDNRAGWSRTLTETWNGTSWSITKSPNRGTENDTLNGVSCTGPQFCEAVGNYFNQSSRDEDTLIEAWGRNTWSIQASPTKSRNSSLLAVSCWTAAHCVAVGNFNSPAARDTLIETLKGTSWETAPSPNPGIDNWLDGVTCSGPAACQAVGYRQSSFGPDRTLVETS